MAGKTLKSKSGKVCGRIAGERKNGLAYFHRILIRAVRGNEVFLESLHDRALSQSLVDMGSLLRQPTLRFVSAYLLGLH